LGLGSDINALDIDKRTPLHHAAEAGIVWAVKLLVKRGANLNLKDGLTHNEPWKLAANDTVREIICACLKPEFMPTVEELEFLENKRYRDVLVNKKGQIRHPDLIAPSEDLIVEIPKPKKKKPKVVKKDAEVQPDE
jgi:hypothetical protein